MDRKINELQEQLGSMNENKGTELLEKLKNHDEESDKQTKSNLMLEISQKSNEILVLKERLNQALESLRMAKGNPFEKAGGSDDEDNKERVVQRNSVDRLVRYS